MAKFGRRFSGVFRAIRTKASSLWSAVFQQRARMLLGFTEDSGWTQCYNFRGVVHHAYCSNIWVYRCIREIQGALAIVPWYGYKLGASGNEQRLQPTSELMKLLNKPNPSQTWSEFIRDAIMFWLLTGSLYIYKVRSGEHNDVGRVLELWVIPSNFVRVKKNAETIYESFLILKDPDGEPEPENIDYKLNANEVMYLRYSDPRDRSQSIAPVWPGRRTIAVESDLNKWNQQIFANSAIAGGFFSVKETLTPEQRDEMRAELEEFAKNKHRPMLLEGGTEYRQWTYNQKDMDFPKLKSANALETCALFGVPPQLVGAVESKYENYDPIRLAFWEETILEIIRDLYLHFNQEIAPTYGSTVFINYDIIEIPAIRTALKDKAGIAINLQKAGYPLNDITRALKLPFPQYEWGNEPFLHSGQTPLSLLLEEVEAIRAGRETKPIRGRGSEKPPVSDPAKPKLAKPTKDDSDEAFDVEDEVVLDGLSRMSAIKQHWNGYSG